MYNQNPSIVLPPPQSNPYRKLTIQSNNTSSSTSHQTLSNSVIAWSVPGIRFQNLTRAEPYLHEYQKRRDLKIEPDIPAMIVPTRFSIKQSLKGLKSPRVLLPPQILTESKSSYDPTSANRISTTKTSPKQHARMCSIPKVKPEATKDDLKAIYHEFTSRRPIIEVDLPIWIPEPVSTSARQNDNRMKSSRTVGQCRTRESFARSDIIPYIERCSEIELKVVKSILNACFKLDAESPGKKDLLFPWCNK